LALRGVNLYLSGYEQTEAGYRVTLLAVHDPGYGPIVGAGILFLLAMAASFYFPHSAVHARVSPGGMVRLAGWAERWAFGFEREFAGLVEEVRGACGSPVAE
jgi:hypothetical protein